VTIFFSGLLGRLRTSLFVLPMLCIAGAVGLGEAITAFDRRLGQGISDLPLGFTSTVESARAVVSTIAGATITVAGIAFSISILMFQLASSQYSPRVIHGLFRDPFNKRVMGLVAGTFTYCLIVLRSIRSAIDDNGEAVIPNVSVAVALVLGIAALLAIVAFINHTAHSMDISRILSGVTKDTLERIETNWLPKDEPEGEASPIAPETKGFVIRALDGGWVDLVDEDSLLRSLPAGGCMRMDVVPGDYVVAGQTMAEVWPALNDERGSTCEKRVRRAVHIAVARSSDQDPLYGLRQLVDVALKALSPGINDPTTAQDAMFHAATLVAKFGQRRPRATSRSGEEGRRLLVPRRQGHEAVLALAYDELRLTAASNPHAVAYLIESVRLVACSGAGPDLGSRLRVHADLILGAAERAGATGRDLARLRDVHAGVSAALDGRR
jgi:uncharacterized membrane protein